ncbi:MAG: hypothetical protein A2W25_11545 [candidate division Zixibacteria bacterium RBG_16_53_22]|nr:MAG: hypothetical protein A2W25_11545 [candidate division Zixibacteria bacterium RBG_16_53_22]
MKKLRVSGRLVLVLAFLGSGWAIAQETDRNMLSVDTLLRMESAVGGWRAPAPQWTPDGSQIIFPSIINDGNLVSLSPEGGFPIRIPINLGGTGWFFTPYVIKISPDGKWIAYISVKSGSREIWVWSVTDFQDVQLTDVKKPINNSLSWSPDSRWIAFSCNMEGNYDIYKISVPSREIVRLTSDKRKEVFPAWTRDSKKVLFVRSDERAVDHEIVEISNTGQDPRVVISESDYFDEGGEALGYPLVSPDGKTVLFRSWRSGWINYWAVPLAGGSRRQIAPEEADQNDAKWSFDGKFIVYTSNHNGTYDLRVVSAKGGEPRVLVSPETGVCGDAEWSPDGTRITYTFTSLTKVKDLFIVALKTGESKQLTFSMPAGDIEKRLVKAEKISYPSTDGFTINAYLYKPLKMQPGEKFPAIVWIHGGPTGQFEEIFLHQFGSSAPDVQFIVQHGYVVLQPNIRGSSGYGKAFEKANNKCWGVCDMEDVLAGVNYLKALPFVASDRMAITGRSYGGILTMAAATNVHGVFRAALAETGYEDWTRQSELYDYELGSLEENRELRWKLSPLSHVEKVTTPIFVILGEGKKPIASPFEDKLVEYKKEHIAKTYPGESSSVHSYEARRQSLLDKLAYYDQYLKDKVTTK